MDKQKNFNGKVGDQVIISLSSQETYQGNIQYVSNTLIELCHVSCQTTKELYKGNLTFYWKEIAELSVFDKLKIGEKYSAKPENRITMNQNEFSRLKDMTYNFEFIDKFGQQFSDALESLKNKESVAVVGLGSTFSQRSLSLLLMADFKKIYIFDLYCLRNLEDFREIFESDSICKVLHGGSALYDYLYDIWNIDMRNIFDTQVVDALVSQEGKQELIYRKIGECLTAHFNFPPSLLSTTSEDVSDRIWTQRPVAKQEKIRAATFVVYLPTFKNFLLKKILKSYSDATELRYSKTKNLTHDFLTMHSDSSINKC